MRCRPFFLLSSFFIIPFLYFNPVPVLQPFSGTDSPGYRWDTVLCISFLFDKSPSGINQAPLPNGALKPFDGTIQTKKRLGYPNRFCIVSTKNTAQNLNGVWCERWDLNPHVKDTRTSNVPVCLFQHSRIFSDLFNQSAFIL